MKAIYTLLILLGVVGCSDTAPEPLAPGKCIMNSDCKGGEHCVLGTCDDIYVPRKERLPYM